MNADRFSPIFSPLPDARMPGPCSPPPVLEFARARPRGEGIDAAGLYSVVAPSTHREPLEGGLWLPLEACHG